MKIEAGKYTLYSDQWSYWITEKRPREKSKYENAYNEERVAGYATSLDKLLSDFRKRMVGGSGAENLSELLEVLRDTFNAMDALDKEAFEHGLDAIEGLNGEKL